MTSDLVDDGRRWWFVGAKLWPSIMPYAAANARAAIVAHRRDWIEAEVANGRSRREATDLIRASGLYVVNGPLTTPEAFERELGWTLAWEMCRWTPNVPTAPVLVEACKGRLDEKTIAHITAQVRSTFARLADEDTASSED